MPHRGGHLPNPGPGTHGEPSFKFRIQRTVTIGNARHRRDHRTNIAVVLPTILIFFVSQPERTNELRFVGFKSTVLPHSRPLACRGMKPFHFSHGESNCAAGAIPNGNNADFPRWPRDSHLQPRHISLPPISRLDKLPPDHMSYQRKTCNGHFIKVFRGREAHITQQSAQAIGRPSGFVDACQSAQAKTASFSFNAD